MLNKEKKCCSSGCCLRPVSNYVLRLTFSFDNDKIQLVDKKRVAMIPFPGEEIKINENSSGFWFEILDDSQKVIYRRVIDNFKRANTEFPAEEEYKMTQGEVAKKGEFTILVPDFKNAVNFVLMGDTEKDKPAREIIKFSFGDLDKIIQK